MVIWIHELSIHSVVLNSNFQCSLMCGALRIWSETSVSQIFLTTAASKNIFYVMIQYTLYTHNWKKNVYHNNTHFTIRCTLIFPLSRAHALSFSSGYNPLMGGKPQCEKHWYKPFNRHNYYFFDVLPLLYPLFPSSSLRKYHWENKNTTLYWRSAIRQKLPEPWRALSP